MTSTESASRPPALVASQVSVQLGTQRALDRVDLTVDAGELVGLIGPNGAGKTTLLRSVLGLVRFDGRILINGRPLAQSRGSVGYVPQRHEFAWDFPISVAGAVLSGRTRSVGWFRHPDRDDRESVAEALERAGITELRERPIGELSAGQRQRVLIARALALRPAVLLLDEPFTGVDTPTQEHLAALLNRLRSEGTALLMTTHDLAAAMRTCTRIALINQRVFADGPPEELKDPALWLRAFGVESADSLLFSAGVHH